MSVPPISLVGLPVFANHDEVDKYFKNFYPVYDEDHMVDKAKVERYRGRLCFMGRMITALRMPHLVFTNGDSHDGLSVTKTNRKHCDGSHHPDTTKAGEYDHFLYRKDSHTPTIESWTATGQIQEFWRYQKDWYDTHNDITTTNKYVDFKDIKDWTTESAKMKFYQLMGGIYEQCTSNADGESMHNLAFMTGKNHNLIVLDIDVKPANNVEGFGDGESNYQILEIFMNTFGWTLDKNNTTKKYYSYCMEKTKSGGLHLYFKYNENAIRGTKVFKVILPNGDTAQLHWDTLSDRALYPDSDDLEKKLMRVSDKCKSYGRERSGIYTWINVPFHDDGVSNIPELSEVIANVETAHPIIKNIEETLSKLPVDNFQDFQTVEEYKGDMMNFMLTMMTTGSVELLKDKEDNLYALPVTVGKHTLETCVQVKKGQKEFRIDGLIVNWTMYMEYVAPFLNAIPVEGWKNMKKSLWLTLINFINRVVQHKNKELYKKCIEDFVVRCRKYKTPNDDEVRNAFKAKVPADIVKKSNHRYVNAAISRSFNVQLDVLSKWESLTNVDDHLDWIRNDENVWNLQKYKLARKLDLDTDIFNFDRGFPYIIDITDNITHGSYTQHREWNLEQAVWYIKHCIAYITNGGNSYYLTKNIRKVDGVDEINLEKVTTTAMRNDLQDKFIAERFTDDKKPERVSLWDVLLKFRDYVTYGNCYFAFEHKNDRYNFTRESLLNVCKGLAGSTVYYQDQLTEEEQSTGVHKIMQVLTYLVGCPNQFDNPEFLFAMDFLAHMIQKPSEKPGVMLWFYSQKTGTGKSTFMDWFGKYVIGNGYSSDFRFNQFERFNAALDKNLLLRCNEPDIPLMRKYYDPFKNLITDPWILVEHKHMDAVEGRNYSRMMAAVNKLPYVEVQDRRIKIYQPVFYDNEDYRKMFKSLFVNEKAPYYAGLFYDYLRDYTIQTKDFTVALRALPKNLSDEAAIFYSLDYITSKILGALTNDEDNEAVPLVTLQPDSTEKLVIQPSMLHDRISPDKKISNQVIKMKMEELFTRDNQCAYEYKRVKINGTQPYCYVFANWKESVRVMYENLKLVNQYKELMSRYNNDDEIVSHLTDITLHPDYEKLKAMPVSELRKKYYQSLTAILRPKVTAMNAEEVITKLLTEFGEFDPDPSI